MKRARKLPRNLDIAAFLHSLPPEQRGQAIARLPEAERETLDAAWDQWAHAGQLAPPLTPAGEAWATWVIMAGRGFGKTLAGAQWITARIAAQAPGEQPIRIALAGATIEDARRVMVEGPSGLIAVAARWLEDWSPSRLRLTFRTGAEATLFSGASPEMLRGPEHHIAWCDELAKWAKPQESWDNLQMGLRLGVNPRALVTTTPRPGPVLRAIMDAPGTVVTGGPTRANPHLSRQWKARIEAQYAGTRLGRQELEGELLPDAAGALWSVELIERCRIDGENQTTPVRVEPSRDTRSSAAETFSLKGSRQGSNQSLDLARDERRWGRVLIAVDPPAGDGTCGIVAVARVGPGEAGGAASVAHVLADHSVTGRSPEGWARAVAAAAAAHGTAEVVAEANQGGQMVKAVLNAADPRLSVRLVTAHKGKTARAEPVAHLCEAGRVKLHGRMPELEAQLLGMIAGGGYEGPGRSPDRADAMVWGVSEVMRERAVARVRGT